MTCNADLFFFLLECLRWSIRQLFWVPHISRNCLTVGWVTEVTEPSCTYCLSLSWLAQTCSGGMAEEQEGGNGVIQALQSCLWDVANQRPVNRSKSHSQAQIQGVEKYCPSLGERSSKLTLQRCIHTRMGEIRGYFLQSTIVDKSSHFPTFLTALALWVFLIFANPKRIKQDLIIVSIFICISLTLSKLVHLFIQLLAQHSCFKITCTHIHEKRLEVYILV